jgi:hypothetical protein
MKPIIYYTLHKSLWSTEYRIAGVTSVRGLYNPRVYGRFMVWNRDAEKFVDAENTNAAGRDCIGKFASVDEAANAVGEVERVIQSSNRRIKELDRQRTAEYRDRDEKIAALVKEHSTYDARKD